LRPRVTRAIFNSTALVEYNLLFSWTERSECPARMPAGSDSCVFGLEFGPNGRAKD